MKIYKFGGASIKDADGIKNLARVIESTGFNNCLLVISAMGKTTNALEDVVKKYVEKQNYKDKISAIENEHLTIAKALFQEEHEIFHQIVSFFKDMDIFLQRNKSPNYDFVYDQVVSCGELIATKIISAYLNTQQLFNQWLDVRDYIKTDNKYREANVNWQITESNIKTLSPHICYVTQGFIGSDDNNFTLTLGREGSDYTAAIFAYCLDAEAMTIWKDVPGVMTGDPRVFENVKLLEYISYEEAIEMAYYGASVIHPKTLQPLKRKKIPFFVKSFLDPQRQGTKIGSDEKNQFLETYILKNNQLLLHIATRDFSFIAEEHLSQIFDALAKNKIKISLMQNSAISLALCLEDKYGNIQQLQKELSEDFKTTITSDVALFTVRNTTNHTPDFASKKTILLEQLTKNTLQMILQ